MTGSPTPNAPTDAWAQCKLIKPENYKGSFQSFKFATMRQITQFKWIVEPGAEKKVNEILKPSIRYALEDCVDLPPTIYQTRMCDLSKEQKHHYDHFLKHQMAVFGETEVTAANAAVLLGKVLQVVAGCIYGNDGERLAIDFGERYSLLEECIEECNEKVIVFVPLTGALELLEEKLKKKWSVSVIDGSVSAGKRNEIFHNFQKTDDPKILLANAGTMAHGLTLTAASTVIWYCPVNSHDTYLQANARIVRPGQKNITNIIHLCATRTEEKIYAALKEKTRLQDVVLELAKEKKSS
jgi:SNF2 family DNA or RNA helicase